MNTTFKRVFGGLSKQYYFRQLFFGALFFCLMFPIVNSGGETDFFATGLFLINALLYPYSRFVYDSIVSFILGNNVIISHIIIMLFVKVLMMTACYVMAIFIAPLGLVYLYIHNSKDQTQVTHTK